MNHALAWAGIVVCSVFPAAAGPEEAGLDERLQFLEPLLGLHWEGGYVGEESPDVVISLRFESVLAGNALKYTREVTSLDFLSETHSTGARTEGKCASLR